MVHVLLLLVLNYVALDLHLRHGKGSLTTTEHSIFLHRLLSILLSRLPLHEHRFLGSADLRTLSLQFGLFLFYLLIHDIIGHYFLEHAYDFWLF